MAAGGHLERENSILKDKVQRLNDLLDNGPLDQIDPLCQATKTEKIENRLKNTSIHPHGRIKNNENENHNSTDISSKMLQMRETQILKLQTEVDLKEKQLQSLKLKLRVEAKNSSCVIEDHAIRTESLEMQLARANELINEQASKIESLTKAVSDLQASPNSQYKTFHRLALTFFNASGRSKYYLRSLIVLLVGLALIFICKASKII